MTSSAAPSQLPRILLGVVIGAVLGLLMLGVALAAWWLAVARHTPQPIVAPEGVEARLEAAAGPAAFGLAPVYVHGAASGADWLAQIAPELESQGYDLRPTSRACRAFTDGSVPAAATRRAFSWASCQLTGPSEVELIMACTWANICCSIFGSFGSPAAFANSAGSMLPMPCPPIRFFSISAKGSTGESSPLEGVLGLEVMVPPIVGVTGDHFQGTAMPGGCLPQERVVRSRQSTTGRHSK
jgi:hypothetical protein